MKYIKTSILVILAAALVSCSDADRAAFFAYGQKHHVTLYSGGKIVREWHTTGKIENEANSDGYYFNDDETHKLVAVSGTVVIEVE